ncbi:DUF6385 domain-containing protein [Paenibacillus guangzhouensis]|uniref:DUF6385 domain-containing protein n=1 Tax=Paenibacillus guangzhouensis TaxID=1473112 RepID=UPI0012669E8B|nr:DUF6385 domain-containing protein [Paenibacillus guangzhouensis]
MATKKDASIRSTCAPVRKRVRKRPKSGRRKGSKSPKHAIRIVNEPTCQHTFSEQQFLGLQVTANGVTLPVQNTSLTTLLSYAIMNHGPNPILAVLEVSPNAIQFAIDQKYTVPTGSMKVINPMHFLKWTRLTLTTESGGSASSADVYFQSQY